MSTLAKYLLIPILLGAVVGFAWLALRTQDAPSRGFADSVNRAIPSVVNIQSTKLKTQPPICQLPQFRELCDRLAGDQRAQRSLGSGVVMSDAGYILTNEHVIQGADDILVSFHDGQTTRASVVGTDVETDLAVLRVEAQGLRTMPIAASQDVRVGDIALAIGNPFGIGQTVSLGIVSAKGRGAVSESPYDDFIQTDAAINLGNSGGALIDSSGNLIGINTLIFTGTGAGQTAIGEQRVTTSQGIGFAIPADFAYHVMMEIVETGSVTRGFLGASLAPTPEPGAAFGLQVTRVDYGGPAYVAGLQPGDIILSIAGQPASDGPELTQQVANISPGTEIDLKVLRNNQTIDLTATTSRRPPGSLPR